MPTPSYNDFLAGVQEEDLRMLALLREDNTLQTDNAAEADVMYQRLERLFTYNMIEKPWRGWDKTDVDLPTEKLWFQFRARVTPTALNYVAQLAVERCIISRAPLPNA